MATLTYASTDSGTEYDTVQQVMQPMRVTR
jgi:hypothetical protein